MGRPLDTKPRGIKNEGATGYASAVLQALHTSAVFHRRLAASSEPLPKALAGVFDAMLDDNAGNPAEGVSLRPVMTALGISRLREERDAVEFLSELLAALDDVCSAVKDTIAGEEISYVQCMSGCDHVSELPSEFYHLPATVKGYATLEASLADYGAPDRTDGYYCERCGEDREVQLGRRIGATGDVLIVSLRRFDFDFDTMGLRKVLDPMEVPERLDLANRTFELLALIEHVGRRADTGGYVAYRRTPSGSGWLRYSDALVTEVPESEALGCCATCLVYRAM